MKNLYPEHDRSFDHSKIPDFYRIEFGSKWIATSTKRLGEPAELEPLITLNAPNAEGEGAPSLYLYLLDERRPELPYEWCEPLLPWTVAESTRRTEGPDALSRPFYIEEEEGLESSGCARPDARSMPYTLAKIGLLRAEKILREGWLPSRPPGEVGVTIIDEGIWRSGAVKGLEVHRFPLPFSGKEPKKRGARQEPLGHGTLMAAVLREALSSSAKLVLRSVVPEGLDLGAACAWLGPLGVAWGIAEAVSEDRSEVILIAMSRTSWGTPYYLRRILEEASRPRPGYPGAAIVCSTGHPFGESTRESGLGVTIGTDELSAQPWVIGVGATDEDGGWCRRFGATAAYQQAPVARCGPAVSVSAPGFYATLPDEYDAQPVDDSSLASSLVAASVALMRRATELSPAALRHLLEETASLPNEVDPAFGHAAGKWNEADRSGHNFKLGHGEVNALGALLAASDPVARAFVLAAPERASRPGWRRFQRAPQMLLAQTFVLWCAEQTKESQSGTTELRMGPAADGTDPQSGYLILSAAEREVLREYVALRPALTRLFMEDPLVREGFLWLGRHLGVLLSDAARAKSWYEDPDHGAFLLRLGHLVDALKLGATERLSEPLRSRVASWCDGLRPHLWPTRGNQKRTLALVMDASRIDKRAFSDD